MTLWIESYEETMRRTRWLSILGAALVFVSVAREVGAFVVAMRYAERYPTEVFIENLFQFSMVAIVVVARVAILCSKNRPYYQNTVSWVATSVALMLYLWWTMPPQVNQICSGNGVCFGIYDMSRPDTIRQAGIVFPIISLIRSTATAFYVQFNNRYR